MTEAETPHEVVLVNRYDASPEQVWAAWTEPDSFVQWWCPPDWKVSGVVMEVRPGGRFQQTQTSPDGGTEQEFRQAGVVTDEHFEALKAGTEMFFTRLGEFLAR